MGPIMTIVKTASETNGASFEMEWEVPAKLNMEEEPFFHTHPHEIETYEMREGALEFFVVDRWIRAKKGDQLSVTHRCQTYVSKSDQSSS
jgi:hypothetical protein